MFINYNYYMNELNSNHIKYKTCLGSKYALLREEFSAALDTVDADNNGRSILILAGGSDPLNIATHIVAELAPCADDVELIVVTSNINPNLDVLKHTCEANKVLLLIDVTDMIHVMRKAQIAISAGGSTLYELCACGVPTITYSFVDNQLPNVLAFSKAGIMPYAGDFCDGVDKVIQNIKSACFYYLNKC